MTEIEDAKKWIGEWIGLSASMIRSGEDFTPTAEEVHKKARASFRTILSALTASQAEVERLTQESADLTKALTGLTRQGSEFFIRVGKRFVADIPACVQDVRERMQRAQQSAVNFAHDKHAAEARATRAEALVEEAGEVLGAFHPITLSETPDFVEVSLGTHQTQAITVAPAEWVKLIVFLAKLKASDAPSGVTATDAEPGPGRKT